MRLDCGYTCAALDLTGANKGRKEGQTQSRVQKRLDQVGCGTLMEWCQLWSNQEPCLLCTVCGEKLESLGQRSLQWAVSLDMGGGSCTCYFLDTLVNCSKTLVHTANYHTGTRRRHYKFWARLMWRRLYILIGLRPLSMSTTHFYYGLHLFFTYPLEASSTPHTCEIFFSFLTDIEGPSPL